MAGANVLMIAAVVLLMASLAVTWNKREGYRLARRTWLLIAGIFLLVSLWLRTAMHN